MNGLHDFPRVEAVVDGPSVAPLLSIDDWARVLGCGRRWVEQARSSGKLPPPDLYIGRLPRWRPGTVLRWIDEQARGKGAGR